MKFTAMELKDGNWSVMNNYNLIILIVDNEHSADIIADALNCSNITKTFGEYTVYEYNQNLNNQAT